MAPVSVGLLFLLCSSYVFAGPSPVRIEEKQHGESNDNHVEEDEDVSMVDMGTDEGGQGVDYLADVPHVMPVAVRAPGGPELCLTEQCIAASNR